MSTAGGLQAVNFKKHGDHPSYKAAVQQLLLSDDLSAGCPQDAAPDLEHFRAVLNQCQKAQGFPGCLSILVAQHVFQGGGLRH